jgi:hypothetical protein
VRRPRISRHFDERPAALLVGRLVVREEISRAVRDVGLARHRSAMRTRTTIAPEA